MKDLSLVPTDDLIEELKGRMDATIIAFERAQGGAAHCDFRYFGGFSACLGLATRFQHRMLWDDRSRDCEPGDLGEFHE